MVSSMDIGYIDAGLSYALNELMCPDLLLISYMFFCVHLNRLSIYVGLVASSNSKYYAGVGTTGPVYFYRSDCNGSEPSIDECQLTTVFSDSEASCDHFDDVSLRCSGEHYICAFIA